MSAAAPTRTRAKPQPKTRDESTQAEANRRNSKKSTGPRTAAGKRNSKFNAVTHGLTAQSVLLPGEDPRQLAARQQQLIDSLQPRHAAELTAIERMAAAIWRSDRSTRAAGNRLMFRLRHEPLEQAKIEQDEAIELGGRLMWQPAFPLPISRRFPIGKLTEPQCAENAFHPHHPARLRLQLEQTIPGVEWLLDRWGELRRRLCGDDLWLSADGFKMVRLMGKHAIEMTDDLDVTRVFLSSLTLLSAPKDGPERESFDWNSALIKMLVTFDVENKRGIAASTAKQCEPFARRLAELPLARLAPKDEEQARECLHLVIDDETRRLQEMMLMLRSIRNADEAEAPARLAFEPGPEGDRYRRYELTNERLALQSYDRFLRTRNFVVTGRFDLIDVDSSPLSVVSGPLSVVGCKSEVTKEPEASDEVTLAAGAERTDLAAVLTSAAHGEEQCDAPAPWEVDQQTPAPSPREQTGCDDEPILRNEANSSVVSGPLSVVGCSVETIDEPIAPDAAMSESHDQDLEAPAPSRDQEAGCDDDGILRNEANTGPLSVVSSPLSVVRGPLSVVASEAEALTEAISPNEPTIGPLSVVSSPLPVVSCAVEAVDEPNAPNEPTIGPLSVVSSPLPVVSCAVEAVDERNAPNEPTIGPLSVVSSPLPVVSCAVEAIDEPSAPNEPTIGPLSVVSSPLLVVSCAVEAVDEPNAPNEPTIGPLSVVSSPLPVVSCAVEAVDAPNAPNEPTIGPLSVVSSPLTVVSCAVEAVDEPNAPNEPTIGPLSVVSSPLTVVSCAVEAVDEANAPNEPTAVQENVTNEPTVAHENAPNEPKLATGGENGESAELSAHTNHDESLESQIDLEKAWAWVNQGVEGRKAARAESLRRLNEESQHEALAAQAIRHSLRGGHTSKNGKPGDQANGRVEHRAEQRPGTCRAEIEIAGRVRENLHGLCGKAGPSPPRAMVPAMDNRQPTTDKAATDNGQRTTDKKATDNAVEDQHGNEATENEQWTVHNPSRIGHVDEITDNAQRITDKTEIVGGELSEEQFRARRFALWQEQDARSRITRPD